MNEVVGTSLETENIYHKSNCQMLSSYRVLSYYWDIQGVAILLVFAYISLAAPYHNDIPYKVVPDLASSFTEKVKLTDRQTQRNMV